MIIKFTPEAFFKIQEYARLCEKEIQGLGRVKIYDNKNIFVEDVEIFEQKVTAANTEMDKDAIADFMRSRISVGDAGDWRLWWHSHADMQAFFSSVDTDFINEMVGETGDWIISMVVNKAGDVKMRVDVYKPFRFATESVTHEILPNRSNDITAYCQAQIDSKVQFGWFPADKGEKKKEEREKEKEEIGSEAWMEEIARIERKLDFGGTLSQDEIVVARQYGLMGEID